MNIDNDFVKQYARLVMDRITRRTHHDPDLTDTCYAKVWERVMQSDNYDEDKGAVSTWLYYIVESVVSNEQKKRARSKDALDHAVDLDAGNNVIGAEDAGTAEDELTRLFRNAQVSPQHMRIFKSYHLEDMSRREIAVRYGLPEETVKSILARTMKTLRYDAAR